MSFNLATILRESALAAPDSAVAKFLGSTMKYRELDEQSGRFAAGLRDAGLQPGEVVAVVVAREDAGLTAEAVIAYSKERLAAYKYPREVRFIDDLPKTPTGKVLKSELRAG